MERAKVEKSMCLKTFPFSKSIIFLYKVWSLNAKYRKNCHSGLFEALRIRPRGKKAHLLLSRGDGQPSFGRLH